MNALLDASTAESLYESARTLFVPDGPGRMLVTLCDGEIAAIERLPVDIMRSGRGQSRDGADFVVPTPAGILAVRRDPGQMDLEAELRPGRHDRGYERTCQPMWARERGWLG